MNPLALHLSHIHSPLFYRLTLSLWKTAILHPDTQTHTLPHHRLPILLLFSLLLLTCFKNFFYCECSVSLELGRVECAGIRERGEFTHSAWWMRGVPGCWERRVALICHWREEPGRLYWSRVGRYVRDGVWQEETVGHRKEWWPWKTRIHRLPLGSTKLSILCACDYDTHIAVAVSSNDWLHLCLSIFIKTVLFVPYMCICSIFNNEHGLLVPGCYWSTLSKMMWFS